MLHFVVKLAKLTTNTSGTGSQTGALIAMMRHYRSAATAAGFWDFQVDTGGEMY